MVGKRDTTHIRIKNSTKELLKSAKKNKETWDELINKVIKKTKGAYV